MRNDVEDVSGEVSLPLLPFDPRKVGPLDLVRRKYLQVTQFVHQNPTVSIAASVAVFAILVWAFVEGNVGLPELPNWFWVAVLASILGSVVAWFVGTQVTEAVYQPETTPVRELDAKTGDERLINVRQDRFRQMTVVTQNDREVDTDYLKWVRINGERGVEVDSYDVETNTAVASWQAGRTNGEIRADRRKIDDIKTDLEEEADKATELLASHPTILRQHGAAVANRLIRAAEGVEVPQGEQLHKSLGDLVEQYDPSEDLLGESAEGSDGESAADGEGGVTVEVEGAEDDG